MEVKPFSRHVILTPDSLGVALMCTGVLELYKNIIGDCELHVLAYHTEFFGNLDFISQVHPITKDYLPIDEHLFENIIQDSEYKSTLWNLDSQPHRRLQKKHITQLLAEKIGFSCNRVKPIVNLTQEEITWGYKFVEEIKSIGKGKPVVYLGLESSTPNKDWKIANWISFLSENKDRYTFISHDSMAMKIPNVARINTTKTQLLSILKQVDACVTVDTYALHGASSRGIDTPIVICILGSSHPEVVCYETTHILYKQEPYLSCQPCGRPYSLFDKTPTGIPWVCDHISCIENISECEVTQTLISKLASKD